MLERRHSSDKRLKYFLYLFKDLLSNPIETYANEVLEQCGQHPSMNALMTKAIYLYKTENYVGARDFLIRGSFLINIEHYKNHSHKF